YIRFASVYRSYPDIQAMRQELDHLLEGAPNTNGNPAASTPKASARGSGESGER
ncbi:MAG: hypothetical protein IVW57_18855, partial [Ktedonobacterales bacterium]|nr:hypothetical protein [Ktedonobacterales bacterium]